jgi:hypothetical protein
MARFSHNNAYLFYTRQGHRDRPKGAFSTGDEGAAQYEVADGDVNQPAWR